MKTSRVRTVEVREHVGSAVVLCGWIHAIRRLGKIGFLVLRDGWGTVQVVMPVAALNVLENARAGAESVVRIAGQVAANAQAPGGVEVVNPRVEVLVAIDEPLPVPLGPGLGTAKLPALLDHAPTVLRDPSRRAVIEIAAGAMAGFRRVLSGEGFTEIQTPKLVGGATESGANVFSMNYFGVDAFLAQSPQLYKQMMVGVFERVFEVGPVFRAEPHATVRHLSEYVSLDVELGFIEDHRDIVALLRTVLAGMIEHLREHHGAALALAGVQLPKVPPRLPEIDFGEARESLSAAGEGPLEGSDLAPAEERWLGEWALREFGSDLLVVSGFPLSKRPFYTHPAPGRPGVSNSFDVLFRGTELVTGGQRIHRHDDLVAALDTAGLSRPPLESYLEAFRFGMPPHGGFAIGLERFVARIAGLANVRLATLFPRDPGRLTP